MHIDKLREESSQMYKRQEEVVLQYNAISSKEEEK